MSNRRGKSHVLKHHIQELDAFGTAIAAKVHAADKAQFRRAARESAAGLVKPLATGDAGRAAFDAMVSGLSLTDRNWTQLARLGWLLALQPNWIDAFLAMFTGSDESGPPSPE